MISLEFGGGLCIEESGWRFPRLRGRVVNGDQPITPQLVSPCTTSCPIGRCTLREGHQSNEEKEEMPAVDPVTPAHQGQYHVYVRSLVEGEQKLNYFGTVWNEGKQTAHLIIFIEVDLLRFSCRHKSH